MNTTTTILTDKAGGVYFEIPYGVEGGKIMPLEVIKRGKSFPAVGPGSLGVAETVVRVTPELAAYATFLGRTLA